MTRWFGRRALFFLSLALVCLVLVPAVPANLRWSAWAATGLALVWAVLLALEHRTSHPPDERHLPQTGQAPNPFDPPPFRRDAD